MSLRQTESRTTATQPYSCTTSSSHSFAALQADDQQLTSENTEACQKVLAQSPALHVCLRRRCSRRSAYPVNCQQDNRAERITSAACNNFTSRGGFLPLHLDRVADCLPFRLSVGVFGSIGALQYCHKADFDATVHSHRGHCPHNHLFYICKKEGKSLTAKQSHRTVLDQCE